MKNTLDQLNNRLDISEEEISELESRAIEAIQDDMQREKKKSNKGFSSFESTSSSLMYV